MMTKAKAAGIVLGLAVLLSASAWAGQASRKPVFTTPHFAFYSEFDVNLNDALINIGVARKFHKPQLFHDGDDADCFAKLPQAVRSAWDRAADYYAEVVSPGGSFSHQQFLLRLQLSGFDNDPKDAEDRQSVEIAQNFRAAAAPAYKACRWAEQDEKNRKWLESLKPQLASEEQKTASRVQQLYQTKWIDLPIPVDIVQTVDFTGANTILGEPGTGHILIANENEAAYSLEVIFHESSHILMGRDAPVRKALEKAAGTANYKLPGELWHVVLFYTTGEAVRRIFDGEGKPGYKPMLYAIFERSSWAVYREALESTWKPYVEGKATLSEAATNLIAALQKQPQAQH